MVRRRKQASGGQQLRVVGGVEATPERDPVPDVPPAPAEEFPEPDEVLGPLFEAFAVGIARARWPLEAELHASEVLADLETALEDAGLELADDAVEAGDPLDPFDLLFAQIVHYAQSQRSPAALAVLRTLAVYADDEFRGEIVSAADQLAASGVKDPVWASTIGRPAVERCWRYGDIFGSQESYHLVFAYGRRRHALAVLVDHELGGGVKDTWVTDDPDQLWRSVRRDAENNPAGLLEELPWSVARESLLEAVGHEPCPVDLDQVEDVARHAHFLAARLSLPADGGEGESQPPTSRRSKRPREVLQLKVTLSGSKPPIWRRLEVPADITLDRLHDVLQVAFGWSGGHLHAFETADRTYGTPEPELRHASERGVRLTRVAPVGEKLRYIYDFGDNWQHVILVEKTVPSREGVTYPRCTGGRRTAPPDDCGGIWGYQDLLDVLADPTHDEYESSVEWLASMWGMQPGDLATFDPSYFKAQDVTDSLAHLAR